MSEWYSEETVMPLIDAYFNCDEKLESFLSRNLNVAFRKGQQVAGTEHRFTAVDLEAAFKEGHLKGLFSDVAQVDFVDTAQAWDECDAKRKVIGETIETEPE